MEKEINGKVQKINDEDYEIIKVIESSSPYKTQEWYRKTYECDREEARVAIDEIRRKYKISYGTKYTPEADEIFDKMEEFREQGTIKESDVRKKLIIWLVQTSGKTSEESYKYLSQKGVKFSTSERLYWGVEHLLGSMGCMANLLVLISSVLSLLLIFIK